MRPERFCMVCDILFVSGLHSILWQKLHGYAVRSFFLENVMSNCNEDLFCFHLIFRQRNFCCDQFPTKISQCTCSSKSLGTPTLKLSLNVPVTLTQILTNKKTNLKRKMDKQILLIFVLVALFQ